MTAWTRRAADSRSSRLGSMPAFWRLSRRPQGQTCLDTFDASAARVGRLPGNVLLGDRGVTVRTSRAGSCQRSVPELIGHHMQPWRLAFLVLLLAIVAGRAAAADDVIYAVPNGD